MHDWISLLSLGLAFLLLFGIAEWLYRLRRVRAEYTRKLVHAGTGLLTLLFPLVLQELWQVALLCGIFFTVLICSMRFQLLPSINAIERRSAGSLLYPVIVVIMFAAYQYFRQLAGRHFSASYYFYLPLLLLALCDPAAALAGAEWKKKHRATTGKTGIGSTVFFIAALIITTALSACYSVGTIAAWQLAIIITGIALCTTLAERFSGRGWDNFSIPAVSLLFLYLSEQLL